MDYMAILLLLLPMFFVLKCIHILISNSTRWGTAKLPPGPYPFPVIGNIFALGDKPHQSLTTLSKTYGPLMSLKLGSITAIVVSSPNIAKQVLQKHDLSFSSRTIPDVIQAQGCHSNVSMVWLPASNQWRNLRKICKEQLFTSKKLDDSQSLRQKKIQQLLDYVNESCKRGEAVDIGGAAFTTALNLLSNTFFSIDLAHYHSESSQEFKDIVWSVLELVGKSNVADYFPVLKSIDPQGLRGPMKSNFAKLFAIFDGLIDQRLRSGDSLMNNDVLQALLSLTKDDKLLSLLNRNDIKSLLLDLFIAGTDTSSHTVEWAMAELLKNPQKMMKAQNELREIIGNDGVVVQEADISRLSYLQAIVKETLRLHPPAPFLIPHKAESELEICGFMVPKNAKLLVNVWAIGRDLSLWLNPELFVPERFIEREIDFRGQDFELIPFGSGRRICPGLPLAHRMVHLMLASLLHSFDWKLGVGMKPEDVDMSDKFGITLKKAMPLKAIPIKKIIG